MRSPWRELPLDTAEPHIRLVQLETTESDQISCTLASFPLAQAPPFSALSYCWGTDPANQEILCNGFPVLVTPNLHGALLQLQMANFKMVWIDSLCIDQGTDEEKNSQVALMGKIYSSAERTAASLSIVGYQADKAVDLIKQLARAWSNHPEIFDVEKRDLYSLHGDALVAVGLPPWPQFMAEELEPLHHLANAPYFSRAWVVQEIVLASGPVVCLYGPFTFPWDDVVDTCRVARFLSGWYGYRDKRAQEPTNLILGIYDTRAILSHPDGDEMTIVYNHRDTISRDPRDKVYALLGIFERMAAKRGHGMDMVPDYSAAVGEVFLQLTVHMLEWLPYLDVLEGSRSPNQRSLDCKASWCHNFHTTPRFSGIYRLKDNQYHNATKDSTKFYTVSGYALQLKGHFVCGDIVSTYNIGADLLAKSGTDADLMSDLSLVIQLGDTIKARRSVCPRSGVYLDGSLSSKAALQTMLSGDEDLEDLLEALTIIEDFYIAVADAAKSLKQTRGDADPSVNPSLLRSLLPSQTPESNKKFLVLAQPHRSLFMPPELKLARTEAGYYCNVSFETRIGDSVVLCSGSRVPFIVRKMVATPEPRYKLLGGCYVHGIMDGEAWKPELAREMWFD